MKLPCATPPATKINTAKVIQTKNVTSPTTSLIPAADKNNIAVTPARISVTPEVICAV